MALEQPTGAPAEGADADRLERRADPAQVGGDGHARPRPANRGGAAMAAKSRLGAGAAGERDTVDVTIRVPRKLRVKVGLKGEVEVDFTRLSRPLLDWLLPVCLDRYFQNLASGPRRTIEDVERVVDAWYHGFPNFQAQERGYPRFTEAGLTRQRAPETTASEADAKLRELAASVVGEQAAKTWPAARLRRRLRESLASMLEE